MFDRIVRPVMMYGMEITGYGECEELEKIQRRFLKDSRPGYEHQNIRAAERETGVTSIRCEGTKRAAKYENKLAHTEMDTLGQAYHHMRTTKGHSWKEMREKGINRLGWSSLEAERRFRDSTIFWDVVKERAKDIERQLVMAASDKEPWYIPPRYETASYLEVGEVRLVARFRCGNECRGTQSWREDVSCRICGLETERIEHLVECVRDPRGRKKQKLLVEDGRGREWMEQVTKSRM